MSEDAGAQICLRLRTTECDHASLNERPMMLKIGLTRQAVNVNEKAGRLRCRPAFRFLFRDPVLLRANPAR